MKAEYQLAGINYEFALAKYIGDYEIPRAASAMKSELEKWLSCGTIEGTDYRWEKPPENLDRHTDRVGLSLERAKCPVGLELTRILSINETIDTVHFEYAVESSS